MVISSLTSLSAFSVLSLNPGSKCSNTCALEVQEVPRFRWLVFLPGHLHSTGVQSCELGGHIPLAMLVTQSGVLIG